MLAADEYGDDSGTVFRDVITLALGAFVATLFLLLPHLNPVAEDKKAEAVEPPGSAIIEVRWPDAIDADIDLWVRAPDETPVGYSNKGGRTFNLLRDDRGHYDDPTNLNYEVSFSRGLPIGEYIINLHYYGLALGLSPDVEAVPVTVVVSTRAATTGVVSRIFTETVTLERVGEETTAMRFAINEEGKVVEGSLTHLFKPLRNGEVRW
ncbi:MAG: hypothetical protein EXQ99_02720 [Alphaproteobacteria bacterium]|nr:hypothetical protein [Alphaproteobacteria bacterium]